MSKLVSGLLSNLRNTMILSSIITLVVVGGYLQHAGAIDATFTQAVLRFLHLLPIDEQAEQAAILSDAVTTDRTRLMDLKRQEAESGSSAPLISWLELEISQAEARISWLADLSRKLG